MVASNNYHIRTDVHTYTHIYGIITLSIVLQHIIIYTVWYMLFCIIFGEYVTRLYHVTSIALC